MDRKLKTILMLILCLGLLTAACGQESAPVDLQKLYEQLSTGDEMPEMIPLTAKQMESYYGLDLSACPQFAAAVCDDGLRVDEIWLIEAESAERAAEILEAARAHVQQLCSETENYLPDQYAVAKDARVLQIGKTAALLISSRAGEMEQLFRESFKG